MSDKQPLLEPQAEGQYTAAPNVYQQAPAAYTPVAAPSYQQGAPVYQVTPQYVQPAAVQPVVVPAYGGPIVYSHGVFGPVPVQITCPNCQFQGFTLVQKVEGGGHSTCCCLSCLAGGLLGVCCFFALCAEDYKDSRHHCPRCNVVVGVYEKSAC